MVIAARERALRAAADELRESATNRAQEAEEARTEEAKVKRRDWANVRLLGELDAQRFQRRPVDGILVSYNPPIFLQRPDLLETAWQLLKPGGRLALVAGRCTTFPGRLVGPFVKLGLTLFGHATDWHYWTVHEPWKHLEELADGNVEVEPRLGFQYLLWAEKRK